MEPDEISLQVAPDQAHQRLDIFVSRALSGNEGPDDPQCSLNIRETLKISPSRSRIRRWIDEGFVTVNGRREKAGFLLRQNDSVLIIPPPPEPTHLEPEDIPVQIVFEDEDLLVVDKPAGLVVHPGAGHRSGRRCRTGRFQQAGCRWGCVAGIGCRRACAARRSRRTPPRTPDRKSAVRRTLG